MYINSSFILVSVILKVLDIIYNWFIFEKAGRKGFEALIPIYKDFVYSEILVHNYSLAVIQMIIIAVGTQLVDINVYAVAVIYVVYTVVFNIKLAKTFGKGWDYIIGLLLLNTLFKFFLAFDKTIVYNKM